MISFTIPADLAVPTAERIISERVDNIRSEHPGKDVEVRVYPVHQPSGKKHNVDVIIL